MNVFTISDLTPGLGATTRRTISPSGFNYVYLLLEYVVLYIYIYRIYIYIYVG